MFYVSSREISAYSVAGKDRVDFPGFGGGGRITLGGDDAYGAVRALDATTGKRIWEFKTLAPTQTSTLATAGNLVFSSSDEGNFFALDASTGKLLWDFTVGGTETGANFVTYEVHGKQYVVAASGDSFVAFSLP
jgi:alcohol dehydrogenase (cytochrome c)